MLVKSSLASGALKTALLRFIRIRLADESRTGRIGLVGLVHAVGDLRIANAGLPLWRTLLDTRLLQDDSFVLIQQ